MEAFKDDHKNPLKTIHTGLTSSTMKSSSNIRPASLTPATSGSPESSLSASRDSLPINMSVKAEKNSKDILAQWRMEREQQGRSKLSDIMSRENSRQNHYHSSGDQERRSLTSKATLEGEIGPSSVSLDLSANALTEKSENDHALLNSGEINSAFLDSIINDSLPKDESQQTIAMDGSSIGASTRNTNANTNASNARAHPKDGNSISTTPTTNTALNTMGIDRLSNRANGSLGVSSLNVRLFRSIQEHNEFPSENEASGARMDEANEEDVSLITQDTELQNVIRPLDADKLVDAIEKEQKSRHEYSNNHKTSEIDAAQFHLHRQSSSSLQSRSAQEAISMLQSSLQKCRADRDAQEQELHHQRKTTEKLQRENAVLSNDQKKDKVVFTDNVKLLYQEVQKIDAMLGAESSSQNLISSHSSEDLNSMGWILDVMKELAKTSIPILLEKIKENKKSLEESSKQLNDTKSEIGQQEKQWEEKLEILSAQLKSKQDDSDRVRTELEKNEVNLREASSSLEKKLEQTMRADAQLTDINLDLGEKRREFTDVNRLCDERIQSAYALECSAQARLEDAEKREIEVNHLHDVATEIHKDAIAATRTLDTKRRDFESERASWETQLHLKNDELVHGTKSLKKREEEMKYMAVTLESKRSELEEENDRMKAVQNDLLEKESQIFEREKSLELEKSSLMDQRKHFEITLAAVTGAKLQMENDIKQFEADRNASEEDLKRRDVRLTQRENDLDKERGQCLRRLQALEENETQLASERKELAGKVAKFKNTVKAAKVEAERKKSQLRKIEIQYREKEQALARDTTRLVREKQELEKVNEECKNKEAEVVSISKKCKDSTNALNKIANEKEDLQKRLDHARIEYDKLVESCIMKREKLGILAQEEEEIQESIIAGEKAREEIMQAIEVKECLLTKIELNIDGERNEWEKKIARESAEVEAAKEISKEKARKYYAEAKAKMRNKSLSMHANLRAAKDELDAKANQLEALHNNLQKMKEKLALDSEDMSKREAALQKGESDVLKEKQEKLELTLSENRALLQKLDEKEDAHEKFESTLAEFNSLRVEKIKLERQVVAKDQILKKYQSQTENLEQILEERNSLEADLFSKEASLKSLQQAVKIKESVLGKLQDRLKESDSTALRLEEALQECESLHIEKKELQDRLAKAEDELVLVSSRKEDLVKRERELESERDAFIERVRAVEEAECRLEALEDRERKLANEYEALSELTNLVEQEKKEAEQKTKSASELEGELRKQRDSLVTEDTGIEENKVQLQKDREKLDVKAKKLKKLEGELKAKLSNVAMSEKKLKDYAKLMKKQTKDLKEKDEMLDSRAKILKEKENAMNSNSVSIAQLQQFLDDERNRYKDLLDKFEKQEVEHSALLSNLKSPSNNYIGAAGNEDEIMMAQRIQHMALRIKEKDEELTKKQAVLEDKLTKCDECETRLSTWQKELEGVAAAIESETDAEKST